MSKLKHRSQFLCNSCGSVHPKWMGKCPDCGTWDSLEEYKAPTPDPRAASARGPAGSAGDPTGDLARGGEPVTLDQIDDADTPRHPSGIAEFDRVLGGGVVPGSAVLVGGEPGIGKSTLLLQVAHELSRRTEDCGLRTELTKAKPAPPPAESSVLSPESSSRVLYVTS